MKAEDGVAREATATLTSVGVGLLLNSVLIFHPRLSLICSSGGYRARYYCSIFLHDIQRGYLICRNCRTARTSIE